MKSAIPDLLGIEYPILQGGMVWVSDGNLAAAVSEAGALGMIGAGGMTPEVLAAEIDIAKSLTDKPFGVNIPLVRTDSGDLLRVMGEKGVKVLSTSAGSPKKHTSEAHALGMKVVHVVSNVRMALKAQEAGVDIIVAEGFEAGGHNGFDELSTLVLVPQVADAVEVPVVAAGGIADARGMVAAFALGAEGVQLGTRFVASVESPAHPNYKELIISAPDTGTVITGRAFGPTRVLKTALAEKILQAEREGWSSDEILEMIGFGRNMRASMEGDLEEGSFMCGQVAGMIREIKPAVEIVRDMVEGCAVVLARLQE